MRSTLVTARITLWTTRFIALILFLLLFCFPQVLGLYCHFRALEPKEIRALQGSFYCCAAVSLAALWNLDMLLRNILTGQVFIRQNVSCIQRIQWCCCGVSLICIPGTIGYPPLAFLVVIMAFLCLVISVLAQVMKAAVSIREENDLTI